MDKIKSKVLDDLKETNSQLEYSIIRPLISVSSSFDNDEISEVSIADMREMLRLTHHWGNASHFIGLVTEPNLQLELSKHAVTYELFHINLHLLEVCLRNNYDQFEGAFSFALTHLVDQIPKLKAMGLFYYQLADRKY